MPKSKFEYPLQTTANPNDLRPNPWNTNVVTPDNEVKLDAAITRLGFFKPIIVREVDDYLEIIGGEHRSDSAKRLRMDTVPIINLGPIDDVKAKEISLADNARYGTDDTLSLAELLQDLSSSDEISSFLPFSDSDLASIFTSSDINLDDLEVDDDFDGDASLEPAPVKAPKTHTIMRFKVPILDAERITELISKTQKKFGYTSADDMTNAGDALVHILLSSKDSA